MYFLIESICLFLQFNLILIIFGYYFCKISKKVNPFGIDNSPLTIFLISWGIGIGLYIAIVYVFVTIWGFNVFTGYLFFILSDIGFIIYCNYSKIPDNNIRNLPKFVKNTCKDIIHKVKLKIIEKKINLLTFIGILFVYWLIYAITYWPLHNITSSLLASDPYAWEGTILYLLRTGKINFVWTEAYPMGLPFYIAGNILAIPNYTLEQIHFFDKMIPTLVLFSIIVIFLLLSFELFEKNKLAPVILTLPIFYLSYFLYRNAMIIAPLLINIVLPILFYLISIRSKEIPRIYEGILLGTSLLIHPLYGLFILVCYILFIIINDLFYATTKIPENEKHNYVFRIKKVITTYFTTIFIIGVLFLTYAINLTVNLSWDWYKNFLFYFKMDINSFLMEFIGKIVRYFNEVLLVESSWEWFNKIHQPLGSIIVYTFTVFWDSSTFMLFLFFLVFPLHRFFDKKYLSLIIFTKVMGVFFLIMYFIKGIIMTLNIDNPLISSIIFGSFYMNYQERALELLTYPVLILNCIGICVIIEIIIKNLPKLFKRHKKTRTPIELELSEFSISQKEIYSMLISSLFILMMVNNLYNRYEFTYAVIYGEYFFDSDYDKFLFSFRETEDQYVELYEGPAVIHYDYQNVKMSILLTVFFSFDHTLVNLAYPSSFSVSSFFDYLFKNVSSGEIIIMTSENIYFNAFVEYYGLLGTTIFQNNRILAIRKI